MCCKFRTTALLLAFTFIIPSSALASMPEPAALHKADKTVAEVTKEYLNTKMSTREISVSLKADLSSFIHHLFSKDLQAESTPRNLPGDSHKNNRHNSNGLGIGITDAKKEKKNKPGNF